MFDYFFELVSSLTRPVAIANANAGILMVAMAIYTGYLIPLPEMHPWFKWIVYVNPLGYAFQSLMANEFHGQKMECNTLIPSGPGYENVSLANQACAFTGSVPGQSYVYFLETIISTCRIITNGLILGEILQIVRIWTILLFVECLQANT